MAESSYLTERRFLVGVGGKLLICVVSVISPAADLSVSSLFVWSQ